MQIKEPDDVHNYTYANCSLAGRDFLALRSDAGLLDLTAFLARQGVSNLFSTDDLFDGQLDPALLSRAALNAKLIPESEVTFRPAIARPRKILMVGLNYRKHAEETKNPIPSSPVLFGKFNNSLSAHQQPIKLPTKYAERFDYEAELVVVIGKRSEDISEAAAMDHVFGYCAGNDLSARELQKRTSQMLIGKSIDGFAPLGPYLVGKNLVEDPDRLSVKCSVNGELRQSSSTADMIFNCRELVSYASRYMTLYPGDVIFTGTPEGVASGFPEPQPWLRSGDEVIVEIGSLGQLKNKMI